MAGDLLVPADAITDALAAERPLTRGLGQKRGASTVDAASIARLRAVDEAGADALEAEDVNASHELLSGLALKSVDVPVMFEFGSAEPTDAGVAQLNALGTALTSDRLAGASFILAGHTDAVGSDQANRHLSKRRADAVRRYLVENFHIGGDRLVALGFGETRANESADPNAADNRRVEVQAWIP